MKNNIILALFSFLFALLVLELALQFINPEINHLKNEAIRKAWVQTPERIWTEYHDRLGWFHQKNKQAHLLTNYVDVEVHTNSQGFRGQREYQVGKVDQVRAVFLGDSFTFGFGVEDDETLTAKMEAMDSGLEALNLAVPGYGIDQMLIAFQEIGKRFRPDYVFIGLYPEDIWRATRAFADSGHAKPYFIINEANKLELRNIPVPKPYQMTEDQFPQLVKKSWGRKLLEKSVFYRLLRKNIIRLGKNTGLLDPDLSEEWALGKRILKALIDEIESSYAEPVLVIMPPERWVRGSSKTSQHESILRFANSKNIKTVDLTDVLQEHLERVTITDLYIKNDWHWTPLGHEIVANTLYESVIAPNKRKNK